jgi:hypothetical protein
LKPLHPVTSRARRAATLLLFAVLVMLGTILMTLAVLKGATAPPPPLAPVVRATQPANLPNLL